MAVVVLVVVARRYDVARAICIYLAEGILQLITSPKQRLPCERAVV